MIYIEHFSTPDSAAPCTVWKIFSHKVLTRLVICDKIAMEANQLNTLTYPLIGRGIFTFRLLAYLLMPVPILNWLRFQIATSVGCISKKQPVKVAVHTGVNDTLNIWAKEQPQFTDREWQTHFEMLRLTTVPSKSKKMTCRTPSIRRDRDIEEEYHGDTQYSYYCSFINDVLKNIRGGGTDYCYFYYQIKDLLKFEKDRLAAKWLPNEGCFQISLTSLNNTKA